MTKKPACLTATIDIDLAPKFKQDLIEQGFAIAKPPYTIFAAKHPTTGVSCTLYESGKIVVQGKEMAHFIEFYLEPEILKEFKFSHPEAHLDLTPRIGLDEAGKGDFFGPLCIAGLYADAEGIKKLVEWGVRDSKRFGDDAILKLAKKIRPTFVYTVIRLFPLKYNELYAKFKNLNHLMAWAHTAALSDLSAKTDCKQAILDQFANPALVNKHVAQKKLDVNLVQRVRGEDDVVVAGASILARAAFLEGMDTLSEEHGVTLPKGASAIVKTVARKIPTETLPKVAKMHFKTAKEL